MEYVNTLTQGKSTTVLAYYLNPGLRVRTGELGSVRQYVRGTSGENSGCQYRQYGLWTERQYSVSTYKPGPACLGWAAA